MNKMTVIQLLNKIANGEKLPEKIKVMGGTYYLCEGDLSGCYYFSEKQGFGGIKLSFDTSVMNEEVEISEDEVEIIEEDKKIEKLKKDNFGNNEDLDEVDSDIYFVVDKINEIIDYINKGDN